MVGEGPGGKTVDIFIDTAGSRSHVRGDYSRHGIGEEQGGCS
jgi:hypothetical protein